MIPIKMSFTFSSFSSLMNIASLLLVQDCTVNFSNDLPSIDQSWSYLVIELHKALP